MKIDLKPCPYCGGIAEGHIKTVESFIKIHNYHVECTRCGASTERYTTEFAMLRKGHFHVLTHKEAVEKAVNVILSILVDTFFARISMPKQQYPEIHNISAA